MKSWGRMPGGGGPATAGGVEVEVLFSTEGMVLGV